MLDGGLTLAHGWFTVVYKWFAVRLQWFTVGQRVVYGWFTIGHCCAAVAYGWFRWFTAEWRWMPAGRRGPKKRMPWKPMKMVGPYGLGSPESYKEAVGKARVEPGGVGSGRQWPAQMSSLVLLPTASATTTATATATATFLPHRLEQALWCCHASQFCMQM